MQNPSLAAQPMGEDSIGNSAKEAGAPAKRQRFDRCCSFMEISMEPGMKSLASLDSKKFKSEIKKWAKAVVTYARQVSGQFGSIRDSGDRVGSSRR
ncbi:uncharacterized protein LOC127794874 [Diospyros lotus]|uniref:uncharacterized protein LOC127794874 n=1 Tax=Diospyros lotus TaxID=55363 RepID=UPI00225B230B|nr:uncharacterized protein LOC127794874 [Diospyros lotus]